MVTPDEIAAARRINLPSLMPTGTTVVKRGSSLMALCPFHPDNNPSMSLVKRQDGSWTYKCFGCNASGDTIKYIQKSKDMTFIDSVKFLISEAKTAPVRPQIVAAYDYCDEKGELLYQILRKDPKGFQPRRPTEQGWSYCMADTRRILYHLSELVLPQNLDKPLWYVEGEKDVESLRSWGLLATTHAFGSSSYKKELLQQAPQKHIILCPDNDDPGKEMMRKLWSDCQAFKKQTSFVLLPSQYKDVSEYKEQNGTLQELLSWVK